MNASRIIGPLGAGAIIASAGSAWVFGLNALLSLTAGFVIMRWRREHKVSPLGRERLSSAIRVGVQFVKQSSRLQGVLARISLFFLHSTALLALLPLVARGLEGGGAGTFTLLLAAMGIGAITAALSMQRVRRWMPHETLLLRGAILQSLATLTVAWAPNVAVAVPAMVLAGMAWITVANTLTVSAQMALPDWVRARGMSIYQMAIMGSTAAGAALWGQIATVTNIHISMGIAAVTGAVAMAAVQRWLPADNMEEDLTPSRVFKVPQAEAPTAAWPHPGPYRVPGGPATGQRVSRIDAGKSPQPSAPGSTVLGAVA
jgi:predicted MFS family arabinose efflux permease